MNEFLRMMPVPNTFRHCTKDYAVPGTDFTIPKGTKIIIPIVSGKLSMVYKNMSSSVIGRLAL